MCAERVQALRWTSVQILIFRFYWVTIWLITITSVRLCFLIDKVGLMTGISLHGRESLVRWQV